MAVKINLDKVKIGSDPEVFLGTNEEIVSSIGLIPGDKDEPHDIGNNCGIQTDNVLAEYTFPPVLLNEPNKFYEHVLHCINYTNEFLKDKRIEVKIQPHAFLDRKYLNTPKAIEAGCEPDFCVWTKTVNNPARYDETNGRAAGCHIHIGYENPNQETSEEIVKAMDLFLGIPSLFIDTDTERRKHYGKAGCFRFKDYGVESRVLSNFVIKDQETVNWLFRNVRKALEFVNTNVSLDPEMKYIVDAINNNDKTSIDYLVNKYNLETNVKQKVCVEL